MTKPGDDFFNLFNMLGQCHRLYISRFYNVTQLAAMYSAVTGVEATWPDLKIASERVWDLWRMLNYRAGFDCKDDQPPEVWFEPLRAEDMEYCLTEYFQTQRLAREDVDKMLDEC